MSRSIRAAAVTLLVAMAAATHTPAGASTAGASTAGAVACECTKYLRAYIGLPKLSLSSPAWNDDLPKNGYKKVTDTTVKVGDIMVWSYDGRNGHVAYVSGVLASSQGVIVKLRGSNQGGTKFTHLGCNNVTIQSRTPPYKITYLGVDKTPNRYRKK